MLLCLYSFTPPVCILSLLNHIQVSIHYSVNFEPLHLPHVVVAPADRREKIMIYKWYPIYPYTVSLNYI